MYWDGRGTIAVTQRRLRSGTHDVRSLRMADVATDLSPDTVRTKRPLVFKRGMAGSGSEAVIGAFF